MTTTQTRRNKRDQAGDALKKLLKAQQAKTATLKAAYEEALAAEQPTRKALESLGMESDIVPLITSLYTTVPCDHRYTERKNNEGPWRCRACGVEVEAPLP